MILALVKGFHKTGEAAKAATARVLNGLEPVADKVASVKDDASSFATALKDRLLSRVGR